MKSKILGLCAIVFAVAFSAFTYKPSVAVYMVYDQVNAQNSISSYSQTTTDPGPQSGDAILTWFRVDDDNGIVTTAEFNLKFSTLDATPNGTLNDEAEISGLLEKQAD